MIGTNPATGNAWRVAPLGGLLVIIHCVRLPGNKPYLHVIRKPDGKPVAIAELSHLNAPSFIYCGLACYGRGGATVRNERWVFPHFENRIPTAKTSQRVRPCRPIVPARATGISQGVQPELITRLVDPGSRA
jgi:hypothetical protein